MMKEAVINVQEVNPTLFNYVGQLSDARVLYFLDNSQSHKFFHTIFHALFNLDLFQLQDFIEMFPQVMLWVPFCFCFLYTSTLR